MAINLQALQRLKLISTFECLKRGLGPKVNFYTRIYVISGLCRVISFFNFELLLKIGVVAVFRSLGGGSKMTGWEINPVGRGIKLTGRKNNPAGRNDNPEQARNYPDCQFRYHSGTPPAYQNTNRTLEVLIKLICNLKVI